MAVQLKSKPGMRTTHHRARGQGATEQREQKVVSGVAGVLGGSRKPLAPTHKVERPTTIVAVGHAAETTSREHLRDHLDAGRVHLDAGRVHLDAVRVHLGAVLQVRLQHRQHLHHYRLQT